MSKITEYSFLTLGAIGTATACYFHGLLLGFFVVSFTADLHVLLIIIFRASRVLNSRYWYLIFLSTVVSLVLTGSAVLITAYPIKEHEAVIGLIWFFAFALKRVLFATGFRGHTRDMTAIFESEDYIAPLPATPPTPKQ